MFATFSFSSKGFFLLFFSLLLLFYFKKDLQILKVQEEHISVIKYIRSWQKLTFCPLFVLVFSHFAKYQWALWRKPEVRRSRCWASMTTPGPAASPTFAGSPAGGCAKEVPSRRSKPHHSGRGPAAIASLYCTCSSDARYLLGKPEGHTPAWQ